MSPFRAAAALLPTPARAPPAAEIVAREIAFPTARRERFSRGRRQHALAAEIEYCSSRARDREDPANARAIAASVARSFHQPPARAVGVPARWQSGMGFRRPMTNLHDLGPEFYVVPFGWVPPDPSTRTAHKSMTPRIRDYYIGGLDPPTMIANLEKS
jgi:hypothetical protein